MRHPLLLSNIRLFIIALVLTFAATDARAQITISVDDIEAWLDRPLSVTAFSLDSLEDASQADALLNAVGENATYDFTGFDFDEVMEGILTYRRMGPGVPGHDDAHFSDADIVTEMEMEVEYETGEQLGMTMWGFSDLREDGVYQLGAIIRYEDLSGTYGSATDTTVFDPPTFSEPLSFTYGDSWASENPILDAEIEVEVTGYGTLITPSGEHRQALRVERTTDYFGLTMKTIEFIAGDDDGVPGVAASIEVSLMGEVLSVSFTETTGELGTSIAGNRTLPESVMLKENYPNPFIGETVIPFSMADRGEVDLRVYDVLGREVAVLVDGVLSSGDHEARFDASGLPSGTYLYRLEASGTVKSGMMTILN